MPDLLIESGVGPIPWDHPAVVAGGTPVFDFWVLDYQKEAPATALARLQDHIAHLNGKPLVVKPDGIGKASWAAFDPDTYGKPSEDTVINGMASGRFNVTGEINTLKPFADLCAGAGIPIKKVLIDDEPGSIVWQSESLEPDDQACNARIRKTQAAMFTNPRILARLGPACRAFAPQWRNYAETGLDWVRMTKPVFDPIQCEIEGFWQKMRMWGKRDILRGVGWTTEQVYDGLTGSYTNAKEWNGWSLPTFGLYPDWASDLFIYGEGRKFSYMAFDLSKKAVRWHPTYRASDPVDDISDRLVYSSPNGATIWSNDLLQLAAHAPAISRYCGLQ